MWKLFLDDQANEPGMPIRRCPDGFTPAKSVAEAQELITIHGMPSFIDFDHDLGDGHDAPELIKWMIIEFVPLKTPVPEYNVHSQNPAGRLTIASLMETWKKLLA